MKLNNIFTPVICGLICCGAAGCSSDITPVYVDPSDAIVLGGDTGEIILSPDNPTALALTVYWSGDGELSLSDGQLQAPVNAAEETLQLSRTEDFSETVDLSPEKGVRSRQFLSEELNSLLGRLGFAADEKAPLYLRVRSMLAANMPPVYSSVLSVTVQSYRIHLDIGTVLDKDRNETNMTLISPEENGVYSGFMGVTGWTNWWLREANNIVWGNLGESGKTFCASSADDHWNFWFPDPSGCYYTTVNTPEGWWSALYIDNLHVSGDIEGEMTYNLKSNQWLLPVNLAAPATVEVTLSGDGRLFDRETTDMGPARAMAVGFAGDAAGLSFAAASAGSSPDFAGKSQRVAVALPAGETMLILDLSDPRHLALGAGEAPAPSAPEPRLYFSGVVDWNGFDDYLSLYDEASLAYGGAHWIDSEWGYRAYPQADWSPCYKAGEGSGPLAGTLVPAESDGNIPAPEKGLYVMDFNLSAMTYLLTAVQSITFTGLNDDWSEHEMTQSADNPEVFTAEFVKEQETPWGVKVLVNHDWSLFFGGGDGNLRLGHSDATTGFDGDNSLTVGATYILTVDLGRQTYYYSLK